MQLQMNADDKRAFIRTARVHEIRLHRRQVQANGRVVLEARLPGDEVVGRAFLDRGVVYAACVYPGVTPHIRDAAHFETCLKDTLKAYAHPGRDLALAFDLCADKPEDGSSSLPLVVRSMFGQPVAA